MKIYRVGSCYDAEKDDFPFRGMTVEQGFDFFTFYETAPLDGSAMPMKWFEEDEHKAIGGASVSPHGFLIVESSLKTPIRAFLPSSKAISADIDGDKSNYVLFCIRLYEDLSQKMDHFFWLEGRFSDQCCTEEFKNFWETRGLTGLDFTLVGILDDNDFVKVEK